MKKRYLKIFLLVLIVFTLSGCTKTLKDEDNNVVKNETTGRTLTENILCKPSDQETIEIYNEIDSEKIESVPDCEDFKINTGGYEGLWTSLLVKPLAFLILKLGQIFSSVGIGLVLSTLFIRVIAMPVTKKTAMQSEKMKEIKPELDRLEKKYKDKKDQESLMQKNQEMMAIYKKNNMNPLSGCLMAFIQLPLFLAFLESINRVPAIFESKFLGLKMGITPLTAFSAGEYWYFILIVLIIGSTFLSFKLNSTGGGQQKQMQGMMKFMIIFISFISFTLPVAIAMYWITSSIFTIFQNLLVKRRKKNES